MRTTLRRPVVFEAELDLHSWLQRLAFLTGGYENDTVRFLLQLHDMGGREGYLLDVGANVGLISIPFARLSASARPRVVAVEAVPDNVSALSANVTLNDLSGDILIIAVALGEQQKTSYIQVEGDLRAGEGTGTGNILAEGTTFECVRQELRVETLDALTMAGSIPPRCSVVKIDTDGYDLKVLQGGVAFLARERPVIFGEFAAHCLAWHGQGLPDVIAFGREHRYEVWRRLEPAWRFVPAASGDELVQDLLLVPEERRDRFRPLLTT